MKLQIAPRLSDHNLDVYFLAWALRCPLFCHSEMSQICPRRSYLPLLSEMVIPFQIIYFVIRTKNFLFLLIPYLFVRLTKKKVRRRGVLRARNLLKFRVN